MINLNEVEIRDLVGRYESELKKLAYQSERVKQTISELNGFIGVSNVPVSAAARSVSSPPPIETVEEVEAVKVVEQVEKTVEAVEKTVEKTVEAVEKAVEKTVYIEPVKKKTIAIPTPEGVYTGTFSYSTGATKKTSKATITAPSEKSVTDVLSSTDNNFELSEDGDGYRLSEWDYFIIDSLKAAKMTLVNNDFFRLAASRIHAQGIKMSKTQLHGKINRSIHKLTHKREMIKKVSFAGKGFAYALTEWFDHNGKMLLRYKRKSIQ
jgi:hypothetical protein